MISSNGDILRGNAYKDIRCLSTDEKPVNDVPNGSMLTEIDTSKSYLFDKDSETWVEVPIDFC